MRRRALFWRGTKNGKYVMRAGEGFSAAPLCRFRLQRLASIAQPRPVVLLGGVALSRDSGLVSDVSRLRKLRRVGPWMDLEPASRPTRTDSSGESLKLRPRRFARGRETYGCSRAAQQLCQTTQADTVCPPSSRTLPDARPHALRCHQTWWSRSIPAHEGPEGGPTARDAWLRMIYIHIAPEKARNVGRGFCPGR